MHTLETTGLAGTATPRSRMMAIGGVAAAVGVVLLVLSVTSALVTPVKLALLLIGVALLYVGVHRLVWALRGKPVDVLEWLCIAWLAVLIIAAILAPLLPLGEHEDVSKALTTPTFVQPFSDGAHPLGTNNNGLDMLARALYGARTSLSISILAVLIGSVVGGFIGVVAGFYRRAVDSVIGILTNALLAIPPLVLLIALSTVLDPNVRNIALALSLLTLPSMVRLARANTIAYAQREFVMAARLMGAPKLRIMVRELVPNVLPAVMSLAVVLISVLIVVEASLSFLGLGIAQPAPTWGNMISEAEGGVMEAHPFIVLVPGAFLFITVFSFNLLGEKAQKRWDPRSAKL